MGAAEKAVMDTWDTAVDFGAVYNNCIWHNDLKKCGEAVIELMVWLLKDALDIVTAIQDCTGKTFKLFPCTNDILSTVISGRAL